MGKVGRVLGMGARVHRILPGRGASQYCLVKASTQRGMRAVMGARVLPRTNAAASTASSQIGACPGATVSRGRAPMPPRRGIVAQQGRYERPCPPSR